MASITTFFGTQGGGGSVSGAPGQVAFFDSSSSVTGSNDLYWNATDGVLAINSFDPTLAGSKLEIQGDNALGTALLTARTGQIWGGSTIMSINEGGRLQLTAYSSTGTNLSSVFIGSSGVGLNSTTASARNIAIGPADINGQSPGQDLTTGQRNVFVGAGAGGSLQNGVTSVAIGNQSLLSCVSSSNNTAVGSQSLLLCTGASNVALGSEAGRNIGSNFTNTFIGNSAGAYAGASPSLLLNTNCNHCVYLGASSRTISSGGATNEIVIGYNATGNGSNSVTLGDTTVTNTYLRGDINLVEGGDLVLGTTTGTKIGTAASQKLAFYGDTPIVQPDNLITSAAATHGSGQAVKDDSTFGGYTIGQIVTALQTLGLLA
jgi:hypothetical protein